jgi:hypothetical protein
VAPETLVVIHAPISRDWVIACYGALNDDAVVVWRDASLPRRQSSTAMQAIIVMLARKSPRLFGLPISLNGIARAQLISRSDCGYLNKSFSSSALNAQFV